MQPFKENWPSTILLSIAITLAGAFAVLYYKAVDKYVAESQSIKEQQKTLNKDTDRETRCLVEALWYEARGESDLGVLAVLSVIQNRKSNYQFPKTYCGVVHQSFQFSYRNTTPPGTFFTTLPEPSKGSREGFVWAVAKEAAEGHFKSILKPSVLYYAKSSVKTVWMKSLQKEVLIDTHQFYRIRENSLKNS